MTRYVPDDARRALAAVRGGMDDIAYVGLVWAVRAAEAGPVQPPTQAWPAAFGDDRAAREAEAQESKVDVAKLPVGIRRKA